MTLPHGIIYNGPSEFDGHTLHYYTDTVTGSTFVLKDDANCETALYDAAMASRAKFDDRGEPAAVGWKLLCLGLLLWGLALLALFALVHGLPR